MNLWDQEAFHRIIKKSSWLRLVLIDKSRRHLQRLFNKAKVNIFIQFYFVAWNRDREDRKTLKFSCSLKCGNFRREICRASSYRFHIWWLVVIYPKRPSRMRGEEEQHFVNKIPQEKIIWWRRIFSVLIGWHSGWEGLVKKWKCIDSRRGRSKVLVI